MTGTIHIEVASASAAAELAAFLAPRGLTGSITNARDHCELEVRYSVDPSVRLREEFEVALAEWLERHEPRLISMPDRQGGYLLGPARH